MLAARVEIFYEFKACFLTGFENFDKDKNALIFFLLLKTHFSTDCPLKIPQAHDQYSRLDFVGEHLAQDDSDGGEDRQGGAHGPTPKDLLPLGLIVVQTSPPIERLEW